MQKRLKRKDSFTPRQEKQDVGALILNVLEQLRFLERKIDTLIGQPREKTFERKHEPKPFQRFEHHNRREDSRQGNDYRERVLHKAICADCNKECEVPFRPSQDRPVYCKDCFGKRKGGGPFKDKPAHKPWAGKPSHADHFDRPHDGEKKKFYEKRKPAGKRKKARD